MLFVLNQQNIWWYFLKLRYPNAHIFLGKGLYLCNDGVQKSLLVAFQLNIGQLLKEVTEEVGGMPKDFHLQIVLGDFIGQGG